MDHHVSSIFSTKYGLNIVTLRKPKGRRNREYKVNLNDRNHIMPTRQHAIS